ncbi:hypothetical protein [Salinibacillus xinjiangensis]|uniref:Uncharacterized protein n=1 Tax=Salinibacillus xinjiangensis TaxID=1229268 RepID=A0A6G1X1Y5_9BACI|nr:hypothetical protein [Salinibacillus xinjiangensis]MRG84993.1 hypothetical protein [Salinibacillus xinjiangensis]
MRDARLKSFSILGATALLGVVAFIIYTNLFSQTPVNAEPPTPKQMEEIQNGLQLTAQFSDVELQPGDRLKVEATLKNESGQTLHYNGRCGIPFVISGAAKDGSVHLINNSKAESCQDIYDPNDIEEFRPGEKFTITSAFEPRVRINQSTETDAPEGEYEISLSFQTEEGENLYIKESVMVQGTAPDIISKKDAVSAAKGHAEVKGWLTENEDIGVVEEDHFIADNIWAVMFHTKDFSMDNPGLTGKRLVVHVDSQSGEVVNVFEEG